MHGFAFKKKDMSFSEGWKEEGKLKTKKGGFEVQIKMDK